MAFEHETVLLDETVHMLKPRAGGTYVDGTLGGAGHARAIAAATENDLTLVGIDRDPSALEAGEQRLIGLSRLHLVHGNFADLDAILANLGIKTIQGAVFDLGISSPQVDIPERGFSFHHDAPLDMRMDPNQPLTAADIVNTYSESDLASVFSRYGEERWAARIANFIVEQRRSAPVQTTGELVELIKRAIPSGARRTGPHPARRTFQALRIAVNDELDSAKRGLQAAIDRLDVGGRIAVITFHSLEDRIVKQLFHENHKTCVCPPKLPICACGQFPNVKIITTKPIVPSQEELHRNPRARSAKLRVAERTSSTNR